MITTDEKRRKNIEGNRRKGGWVLFTVLIQNKKTCDSFYEHLPLFQGFLEDDADYRQIEVCEWNEAGKTLEEALPDLHRLTDDKPKWRAVIVRHEDEMPLASHPRAHDNPYDFLDIPLEGLPDLSDPSSNPLVALVQSLAHPLEYFDRTRMKEGFTPPPMKFDGIRPESITLISVRHIDELLSLPGSIHELENPDFVESNHYPSLCRFAVVDRFHQGPYRRRRDDFEFWNIVLMLATSRVDASFLEAYTLHTLAMDVDPAVMQEVWNEKYTELVQMDRQIQHLLEHQSIYLQKYEGPYPNYSVTIDHFDPLPADLDRAVAAAPFLKVPDNPRELSRMWEEKTDAIEEKMEAQWKEAPNAIQKKINALHLRKGYASKDVHTLSSIQLRQLRDELEQLKLKTIDEEGALAKNCFEKAAELKDLQEKVRLLLLERMQKKQLLLWILALSVLGAAGMIPGWIALWQYPERLQLVLLGFFTLLLAGVPAAVLLWCCWRQTKATGSAIGQWNTLMTRQFEELGAFRDDYIRYMSDALSYRRGESYYDQVLKKIAAQKESQRKLEDMQRDIRQFISRLSQWAGAYNLNLQPDQKNWTARSEPFEEVDLAVLKLKEETELLFRLEPATSRQCEINETGRKIPAPFSFVNSLSIRSTGRRKPT